MRLLVVEDKVPLNSSLSKILRQQGFAVDQAFDGQQAIEVIDDNYYNLIILDLTLPQIDGLQVIKTLREDKIMVPILVLTARASLEQVVTGLRQGADDYLTKPFEIAELLARVQALLRRENRQASSLLQVADLSLDTTTGQVQRSGKDISLTSTEYRLLCYLMMKSKWIVGKRELLTHVWQNENDVYDRVVDTYVCFLRRKIDKAFPHLPALIHTHKTRGYQVGLIHEKPKHH